MFDSENSIFFCICGKKVDRQVSCGELDCQTDYDLFQKHVNDFFDLMESVGVWKGYQKFETLEKNLQIGILFELEDELMLLFLQALGQEKVLELLQSNNDALRYRFLELLEPLLEKEVFEEFQSLNELNRAEIQEFLLHIISIILKSVQIND